MTKTNSIRISTQEELNNSSFDIHAYDKFIVYFSGGKDSMALVLYLLSMGVDTSRIELWHHDIDGREGSKLMDWPVTRSYCQAFAQAFQLPIFFSWKKNGFEGEMLRKDSLTAPTIFEDQDHNLVTVGGVRGKKNTRLKFPQVSADLKVRWCSAYLKIDIAATAIRNQDRFKNSRTLVLSGERAEESSARSKYFMLEPDRSDNRTGKDKRLVDRLRPIKYWSEKEVWDIIKAYRVRVHPAYYMGWSRVSCMFCIFGNKNQWKSASIVSPCGVQKIINYENDFGLTIQRKESVAEMIEKGAPYEGLTKELIALAKSEQYPLKIVINPEEEWILPLGAFGESCGPS